MAPYDQHLSLDDVPLENNDKTLAQLNVYPGSLLMLRVSSSHDFLCLFIAASARPASFMNAFAYAASSPRLYLLPDRRASPRILRQIAHCSSAAHDLIDRGRKGLRVIVRRLCNRINQDPLVERILTLRGSCEDCA